MVRLRYTVAMLVALLGCSSAQAQDGDNRCAVQHPHAERGETVVATMSVVNDGKPCTMHIQLGGRPATSTAIRTRPANGALTSTSETVSYTPNPGFSGKDAFDVQWFGVGFGPNSESKNIRTKVDVTVRATSDAPEVKTTRPAM